MSGSRSSSTTSPPGSLQDAPDVLTVPEAAHYLRIGRNAAYDAIRNGDLYAIRVGRSLRVPRSAVERMLDPRTAA